MKKKINKESETIIEKVELPKCKLPGIDDQYIRRIREKAFEDGLKLGHLFHDTFEKYTFDHMHQTAFFYGWICLFCDERMRKKVERQLLPFAQSKLEPKNIKKQGVSMESIDSILKHAIENLVNGD